MMIAKAPISKLFKQLFFPRKSVPLDTCDGENLFYKEKLHSSLHTDLIFRKFVRKGSCRLENLDSEIFYLEKNF